MLTLDVAHSYTNIACLTDHFRKKNPIVDIVQHFRDCNSPNKRQFPFMILKSLLTGDSGLHQTANKGEDNVAKDFVSLGADVSAVDNKVYHAFIIPSS